MDGGGALAEDLPMATPSAPTGAPERALIVEPNATVRAAMAELVRGAGFEALTAESAEAARPLLAQQPRVVFTDLALPGQTGDQFCRELRMAEATWDTPVIVTTAIGDAEAAHRCLWCGADDFILKPAAGPEVQAKLEAVRGGGEPGFQRRLNGKRLMLATPHAYYLQNIAQLVRASGADVVTSSGFNGVKVALESKTPPDVVLLDIDALGLDAQEQAKSYEVPGAPPTLFISMASTETLRGWATSNLAANAGRLNRSLSPFDSEDDRDDILRHISRALTMAGARGSTRRKVRVPFYSPVRFRWTDEEQGSHGIGLDLSESGIFVRTLAPLRPAPRRTVELTFQIGGQPATVRAMVAWANGFGPRHVTTTPFGMGISFAEMNDADARRIKEYVTQRMDGHTS